MTYYRSGTTVGSAWCPTRNTLKLQVTNSAGTVLPTPATFANQNAAAGFTQRSVDLAGFAGQTVTLKFTGTEDFEKQTSFVVDDTAVNVS